MKNGIGMFLRVSDGKKILSLLFPTQPPTFILSSSDCSFSDENEVVLMFIDRCHGLEEKGNICWNQTDLGEGVQILAPFPGAMQLWVNV